MVEREWIRSTTEEYSHSGGLWSNLSIDNFLKFGNPAPSASFPFESVHNTGSEVCRHFPKHPT